LDDDGPIGCLDSITYGDGEATFRTCAKPMCTMYGPWPPPSPSPHHNSETYQHTYATAGTYSIRATYSPANSGCQDSTTGRSGEPYESSGSGSATLTVA
jgi:hypothetical protein